MSRRSLLHIDRIDGTDTIDECSSSDDGFTNSDAIDGESSIDENGSFVLVSSLGGDDIEAKNDSDSVSFVIGLFRSSAHEESRDRIDGERNGDETGDDAIGDCDAECEGNVGINGHEATGEGDRDVPAAICANKTVDDAADRFDRDGDAAGDGSSDGAANRPQCDDGNRDCTLQDGRVDAVINGNSSSCVGDAESDRGDPRNANGMIGKRARILRDNNGDRWDDVDRAVNCCIDGKGDNIGDGDLDALGDDAAVRDRDWVGTAGFLTCDGT